MPEPPDHTGSSANGGVTVIAFTESLLQRSGVEEVLAAVATAGCLRVVLDCQAVRSLLHFLKEH
jgi:hypothetical protein